MGTTTIDGSTVADPGGGVPRGPWPPPALYKQVIKKMAAKGGHIDFMFLSPPTRPLDPMLIQVFSPLVYFPHIIKNYTPLKQKRLVLLHKKAGK